MKWVKFAKLQTFPTLILSLLHLFLLFLLLSLYSFFFFLFFFNFKSLLSCINFDIKTSFLVVSIGEQSILETQYNNQTLEFVESSKWKKKKKSQTHPYCPQTLIKKVPFFVCQRCVSKSGWFYATKEYIYRNRLLALEVSKKTEKPRKSKKQ
jgi:hypothetical protein